MISIFLSFYLCKISVMLSVHLYLNDVDTKIAYQCSPHRSSSTVRPDLIAPTQAMRSSSSTIICNVLLSMSCHCQCITLYRCTGFCSVALRLFGISTSTWWAGMSHQSNNVMTDLYICLSHFDQPFDEFGQHEQHENRWDEYMSHEPWAIALMYYFKMRNPI